MIFHIGLGSNEGKAAENLAGARRRLSEAGIATRRASSLYRTEPVGFRDQAWFLNQVLEVETDLSPWGLLRRIKEIEARMGRRPAPRNRPRIIDIDILLAESAVVQTATLTVPHPRLAERNFALVPLAEIAPSAVHPLLRVTVSELLRRSPDRARVGRVDAPAPRGRSAKTRLRIG
jgi:2-amino-4-hydroxy-6-hydroxymethyldihydropteridine diphosphokinase